MRSLNTFVLYRSFSFVVSATSLQVC